MATFLDSYDKLYCNFNSAVQDDYGGHTLSANGNASVVDGTSPDFGSAYAVFDGSGDRLTCPNSSDWTFGTGDFTLECRIKVRAFATHRRIFETESYSTAGGILVTIGDGTGQIKVWATDTTIGSSGLMITSSTALNAEQWYHIAVTRESGVFKLWIDGTQDGSYSSATSYNLSNNQMDIGGNSAGGRDINAEMDEIRVSKGVARFTTSFTVPTTEYSSDAQTVLLLHCNGTSGSTTFTDSGNTGHTITANGNAQLLEYGSLTPKFGDKFLRLDKFGDYVSAPASSDWDFGTGDFTIDFWARTYGAPRDFDNIVNQFDGAVNGSYTIRSTIFNAEDVSFTYYSSGYTDIRTSTSISDGEWHHVAVVRNSGTIDIYIDGVSKVSATFSGQIGFASGRELRIGDHISGGSNAGDYIGDIDELRISKGIARWTSNFTPETEEYLDPTECANGLDDYVRLMCHFDGSDGSTTLLDDHGSKTLTANGDAQLDTAQKKFGTASLLLDGTGDYVTVDSSGSDTDFDLGSMDWTFDCQIRVNTLPTSGNAQAIFGQRSTPTSQNALGVFIFNDSGEYKLTADFTYNGTTVNNFSTAYNFTTSTWYHIAICRNSNWLGFFVDGVNIGCYYIGSNSIHNSTADFKIGGINATTSLFFNGWIDEFRFSKWICRYTIKTYDVETGEYTADGSDVLLLHMDGSDGSTTFTDSADSKTVTANGNAQIKTSVGLSPKFGTGSALFDSSGDYLSASDSSDWDFGSGNFTIDMWVYLYSSTGTKFLAIQRTSFGNNHAWGCFIDTGKFGWQYTTNGTSVNNTYFDTNVSTLEDGWHHIAYVRNGTTLTLYIDGVAETTTVNMSTNTIYNSSANLEIGGTSVLASESIDGLIDEFRISKGTAEWTTNFTPPSSEYADSTYELTLHCNGSEGSTTFTDDGVTGHTITANGNAQITQGSPINPKFGTGMAYFDSTDDYLSLVDSADWNFGSGNFTIDTWVNISSSFFQAIASQRDTFNNNHNLSFFIDADNNLQLEFTTNGTTNKTFTSSSSPIEVDSWHHVVVQRKSNYLMLAVDGYILVQKYVSTDSLYDSTERFLIGTAFILTDNPTYEFDGLMDEFRVSKGVNRYTPISFTAPTSAYSICTGITRRLKYWNGSAWEAMPLKYWNGSAWEEKELKYWNGSAWA